MQDALRSNIEQALNEMVSNENGMGFQGLVVVLGKLRWRELVACERKNDCGLDAHLPAGLASDGKAKGLASSITSTLAKIRSDAKKVKTHFPDVKSLLFATATKVTNLKKKEWAKKIKKEFGYDLFVLSREEIIAELALPENARLCRTHLHLDIPLEATVAGSLVEIAAAALDVANAWTTARTKNLPLMELRAVRVEQAEADSADVYSLDRIATALSESRRLVLEAPAGRGKTTCLLQLAALQLGRGQKALLVDLPQWIRSGQSILDFVSGIPPFQVRSIDASALARGHAAEQFSFLLNGWNEISDADATSAATALRDLEQYFPAAGIIVATRTHHLAPQLPGAVRLRLLPLTRQQRSAHLRTRLAARANDLDRQLNSDAVLDELTRTPFILNEVIGLFEAGVPIPRTRMGVISAVIRLFEQQPEHQAPLSATPVDGCQTQYLQFLAADVTANGTVRLTESDGRSAITLGARALHEAGQITSPPSPAAVLNVLVAHHLLVRSDHPVTSFGFEHQQFQEYYAGLFAKDLLLKLTGSHQDDARRQFISKYVNAPAWAEPLRMLAEVCGLQTDAAHCDQTEVRAGAALVEMALAVDPVFAAELAQLAGPLVWREVEAAVSTRLRDLYASANEHYRHCGLAAMIASGSPTFRDVLVPLLSGDDQEARLEPYRLWSVFHPSSLGADWRETVSSWPDEARTAFVSEILRNRFVPEVASFASSDPSLALRAEAVTWLMWTGTEDEAARVLLAMAPGEFSAIIPTVSADFIPAALHVQARAALRESLKGASADAALRLLLELHRLGDPDVAGEMRRALDDLQKDDLRRMGHAIQRALDLLRLLDSGWTDRWISTRLASGALWSHEHWLPLVSVVPKDLADDIVNRLATEDLTNERVGASVVVAAAGADAETAARVVSRMCDVQRIIDAEPDQPHEYEWHLKQQLDNLFREFPADIASPAIQALAASDGDAVVVTVVVGLLSSVARHDHNERVADFTPEARQALRSFLKRHFPLMLEQDDFSGAMKADLASVLAQIGEAEDIADLATLVRADITRMQGGRAARASGDRGRLSGGASMSYAPWHVQSIDRFEPTVADPILLELIHELDYEHAVAEHVVRFSASNSGLPAVGGRPDFSRVWVSRANPGGTSSDAARRGRYAEVLSAKITALLEERSKAEQTRSYDFRLMELTKALAACGDELSAPLIFRVLSLSSENHEWRLIETLELLLCEGMRLPAAEMLPLWERVFARASKYGQQNERYLIVRGLSLLAFVDEPTVGIREIEDWLTKGRISPFELSTVLAGLGQSRCTDAVDVLRSVAESTNASEFDEAWINAAADLDFPEARELLLGFVDPSISFAIHDAVRRRDVAAARLAELARQVPDVAKRLRELCEAELPPLKRAILAQTLHWIGTSESLLASLLLIDDAAAEAIPYETRAHIEDAFIEQRPHPSGPDTFTRASRPANAIRVRLFEMARNDERRQRSALSLLGQIEEWRLEYGRPVGEPRNPVIEVSPEWPPVAPGQ